MSDRGSSSGVADRGITARVNAARLGGTLWRVASRFGVLVVLLQVYSLFRKRWFVPGEAIAYDHALDILRVQERLGIDVELDMQAWVLERAWAVDFFNLYYRQMKPALYLCALLALLLAPVAFGRIGAAFVVATLLGWPCYALYPLAPPRFMGQYGYPFVDTIAVYGEVQQASGGLGGANQFAAMPSMHVAWTAVAVLWLAAALPWRRVGALLGALHLTLMCVAVVVTGNHYLLDVVAGLAVAGTALAVARLLPVRALRRIAGVDPHLPAAVPSPDPA